METYFPAGRIRKNNREIERPIKRSKAFRLMGLMWSALLAAATVTPVLPPRHETAQIQIASLYAYHGDEINIPADGRELIEAELHAVLQSNEADEETWLALMCMYADTINQPAFTSANVRAAFYGTAYPDIGLLQFSSLATMGKYTPDSADVRNWRHLPLTEQHYYETREYPDGTDSRLFDINRLSNDCLGAHGIDTIPPGQNVAFFISHLPDAEAYGGTFSVYNPQTASNELRGAVWAQGVAPGTLAHEVAHTPQFNSSHELSESGLPELNLDRTAIEVDSMTGREYQVLWSPTGYGSRVGLPAATLYNNGYIDDSMVTSIPVTDISEEFELDLEALYPGLLSQKPQDRKSYAIRIELPLSQNGATVMPNRFNRTNPGAGLAPREVIWIDYRNGEENREEGQPVNIDAAGGLPSGFVVYVEQNYHPHIEGSRSILWYPKQYKPQPDGTFKEVRDYARQPLSPFNDPFQPWSRNMVSSTEITICPQVSAKGKHTVNVGINTGCQAAALTKVYLPRIAN